MKKLKSDIHIWALYDKLKSSTKVAEELGVPERTMSRKIRALKQEFGEMSPTTESSHMTKKEGILSEEAFIERLRGSLAKTSPTKPFPPKKRSGETLVLQVQDWHIGSKDADSAGKLRYDLEIAAQRAQDFCRKALSLTKQHVMEGTDIDEIAVCVLGDMVDGDDMYASQMASIEYQPPQQVIKFVEIFRDFLAGLAELKLPINVYCIKGNHGRTGKDKSPKSNWDLMAYLILEDWARYTKIPKLYIEHSELEQLIVPIRGWKFGLVHKTALTLIPSAGTSKALGWTYTDGVNCILTAHWHHFRIEETKGLRKYLGGSLKGTDEYADSLGVGAPPSQLMFGVTEKHLSTFIYVVDLQ